MEKKNQEAQLAYELWEKMAQLESKLWDKYNKEFIDIVMDQQCELMMDNDCIDDTHENDIPF